MKSTVQLKCGDIYCIPFDKLPDNDTIFSTTKFFYIFDLPNSSDVFALPIVSDSNFTQSGEKNVEIERGSTSLRNKSWIICSNPYKLKMDFFVAGIVWCAGSMTESKIAAVKSAVAYNSRSEIKSQDLKSDFVVVAKAGYNDNAIKEVFGKTTFMIAKEIDKAFSSAKMSVRYEVYYIQRNNAVELVYTNFVEKCPEFTSKHLPKHPINTRLNNHMFLNVKKPESVREIIKSHAETLRLQKDLEESNKKEEIPVAPRFYNNNSQGLRDETGRTIVCKYFGCRSPATGMYQSTPYCDFHRRWEGSESK